MPVVVVLPTPPFWFVIVMTSVGTPPPSSRMQFGVKSIQHTQHEEVQYMLNGVHVRSVRGVMCVTAVRYVPNSALAKPTRMRVDDRSERPAAVPAPVIGE